MVHQFRGVRNGKSYFNRWFEGTPILGTHHTSGWESSEYVRGTLPSTNSSRKQALFLYQETHQTILHPNSGGVDIGSKSDLADLVWTWAHANLVLTEKQLWISTSIDPTYQKVKRSTGNQMTLETIPGVLKFTCLTKSRAAFPRMKGSYFPQCLSPSVLSLAV